MNKNQDTAFCAFGADNALGWDHFDSKRSSKVFLIAPELSQLSAQAKSMAGVSFSGKRPRHYALTTAVFSREEKGVEKLLTTMEGFTNPFEQKVTHFATAEGSL